MLHGREKKERKENDLTRQSSEMRLLGGSVLLSNG